MSHFMAQFFTPIDAEQSLNLAYPLQSTIEVFYDQKVSHTQFFEQFYNFKIGVYCLCFLYYFLLFGRFWKNKTNICGARFNVPTFTRDRTALLYPTGEAFCKRIAVLLVKNTPSPAKGALFLASAKGIS
jgi:hypothetical protein